MPNVISNQSAKRLPLVKPGNRRLSIAQSIGVETTTKKAVTSSGQLPLEQQVTSLNITTNPAPGADIIAPVVAKTLADPNNILVSMDEDKDGVKKFNPSSVYGASLHADAGYTLVHFEFGELKTVMQMQVHGKLTNLCVNTLFR